MGGSGPENLPGPEGRVQLSCVRLGRRLPHAAFDCGVFLHTAGASSGSKLMRKRLPVAFAYFSKVRVDGILPPPSSRATTACVVFMRRATCCCVKPARDRASIRAAVRENSSSSASYSRRYLGSSSTLCANHQHGYVSLVLYLLRSFQRESNFLSACFPGFLKEHADNDDTKTACCNVDRPGNTVLSLHTHLPQSVFEILYMGSRTRSRPCV